MFYEGKRYGVFSDEVNDVVSMVHERLPRQDIEARQCPVCGANLRASFWPDGGAFVVVCGGPIPHSTRMQSISTPPSWWRACVHEVTEWTSYWKKGAEPNASGNSRPPGQL